MYTKNAELKAGIVVLAALVTFVGFLFYAGGADSLWEKHRSMTMRLLPGTTAPKEGDPVLLNGFPIGRIETVDTFVEVRSGTTGPLALRPGDYAALRLDPAAPPPPDAKVRDMYVLAIARLDAGREIPEGTTAEISKSITGSRELQVKPGISLKNLSDEDMKRSPIPVSPSGDFGALQRSVQALTEKVGTLVDKGSLVVDRVATVLDDVRSLVRGVRTKIDEIDVKGIQDGVLGATTSLRSTLGTIDRRVEEISARLVSAATNVDALTGRGKEIVDATGAEVAALLADLRSLVADMDAVVGDVRPKVNAILDDVRAASASIARLGEEFRGLGPRLDAIVGSTGSSLEKVFARLVEVGHNLSDVSEDLRAHPWKLLNKPDDNEIAFENLRNAASSYVRASGSVQDTVKELKELEARRDLVPEEQSRLVKDALGRLEAAISKYAQSEQFFSQLLRQGSSGTPRIR